MFDRLIDTNNYHTRSALEIEQRIREREETRQRLLAEYSTRTNIIRTPVHKRLVGLLTGLFGLSV